MLYLYDILAINWFALAEVVLKGQPMSMAAII